MKIGIIHIQSGIYPLASYDFADAIVEGLLKEGIETQVFTQEAETGTNVKLVAEKALKLFRIDKVDAIFTLAESAPVIEELEKMAVWIKKPIFIVSLGARLGVPATPSGFIHFHEMDAWKSAWQVGRAMGKEYQPITYMVALYEAGYQFAYAFSRGVLSVEGTISPAFYVQQKPQEAEEVAKMFAQIEEFEPKAIFLCMSFKESAAVLSAYSESQWAKTPLYVSPFVLNEYANLADVAKIETLYEISAIDYEKMTQHPLETVATNEFSLLGFEAGRIFGQKHKNNENKEIIIDSPRGTITLPEGSFRTNSLQYLYKISVANEKIQRTLVNTFNDSPEADTFLAGQENLVFSQWANPYLFA